MQAVCAEMSVWVCDSSCYGFASVVYSPSVFYFLCCGCEPDFVVPVLFSSPVLLVTLHALLPLSRPDWSHLLIVNLCFLLHMYQVCPASAFSLYSLCFETLFSASILLDLFASFGPTPWFGTEPAPSAVSSFVSGMVLDMRRTPTCWSVSEHR